MTPLKTFAAVISHTSVRPVQWQGLGRATDTQLTVNDILTCRPAIENQTKSSAQLLPLPWLNLESYMIY